MQTLLRFLARPDDRILDRYVAIASNPTASVTQRATLGAWLAGAPGAAAVTRVVDAAAQQQADWVPGVVATRAAAADLLPPVLAHLLASREGATLLMRPDLTSAQLSQVHAHGRELDRRFGLVTPPVTSWRPVATRRRA